MLPLKIWKINPVLKLRTAYYKSFSKDTGDIWDKILQVGREAKLKRTKPDSNSTFNSTTTYKSPLIKDNSSILKIKVLLAAWLLFKFWFYILLNCTPWKKNKGEITCTTLRNPFSFNGWGWELPSELFHYEVLSHVTSERRDRFQSRICIIKFLREANTCERYFGVLCIIWDNLKRG